jgi:hypothetical protein
MLASVSAQAQAFSPIRITGVVTDFKPADCGKAGSITFGTGANAVTIPIAAGAVVAFRDVTLAEGSLFGFPGQLVNAAVTSEVWQVMGSTFTNQPPSVRTLNGYLDPQGRLRLQLGQNTISGALSVLPLSATATRPFEITGVVTAASASSFTLNGLTFPLAAAVPGLAAGPNVVRIRGTANGTNQITGALITPAYTTTAFPSLSPTDFRSVGVGLTNDVNPFDADGPIANNIFIYNPIGTAAGEFLCDESVERITLEGQPALFFAPNFTMRSQISTFVPTTFTFQLDQFGWIAAGTFTKP